MRLAIDLNDVLRDFSPNFLKTYCQRYNHEYNLDNFEYWTNDMSILFPFASDNAYSKFVYADYVYELFGKCDVCERGLEALFNTWVTETIHNLGISEPIELLIVSAKEYGESIGASLFFLSKIGSKVREVYFPKDSATIWDKCDALITANPSLLECKPEGKKAVKIKREYNSESGCDLSYSTLTKLIKDEDFFNKLEIK